MNKTNQKKDTFMKWTRRKTTANKVLPKTGLNGFDCTFVQGSTFVLRLNFCAKNPHPRQHAARCATYKKPTAHLAHLFFFPIAKAKTKKQKS